MDTRTVVRSVLILLCIVVTGCSSHPSVEAGAAPDLSVLKELPVVSPWSIPLSGLRCRIALERDAAVETTAIRGALVLENTSAEEVTLTQPAHSPLVTWTANGALLDVNTRVDVPAADAVIELKLPAHSTRVMGPWTIFVPPGKSSCILSASFHSSDRTLTSPSMQVDVSPAQWGAVVDGMRLRLSVSRSTLATGENLDLHLFIHNVGTEEVGIYDVDFKTLDSYFKQDRLTLTLRTGDQQLLQLAPGMFLVRAIPEPQPLVPGEYRLRLVLSVPELPPPHAPGWTGKLTSNEITLQVVGK